MNILFIGRDTKMLEVVVRLINGQPGWQATGAQTDANAIELFVQHTFDLVLVGAGVDQQSVVLLTDNFRKKNASIKIVMHYGGGSGLLFNEIREAIGNN